MQSYTTKLKSYFEKHANPSQAAPMKKYMRDQFEYLGIKTPQSKLLMKEFISEHGLPPIEGLDEILRDLWSLPQREFQYAAMNLLDKFEKRLPENFISTLEYLIVTKSWWDTVDALASHPVGTHFKRFPKTREKYLMKWRTSKNMWLRRTAILFQLGYKKDTDFGLLCDIIRENLGSDEFFINKAIGWALRQYAYTDAKAVKKFVKETNLHPLSQREAMKHL
ncbi:MAG TPA: DNA alkylation repair protein [Anaerolineales bacterium]|jgi:3-methyladenine DNA glycosylase AlkD|nr:DNA alkylation repair protein [Anaerolineales bacterium]HQX16988.1 DNA alkylation repair protein [Anaerolineales bacterium]